ncbi:MAG: hypothetical protein WB696_08905 [Chthoniobacterales bacterium]
MTFFLDNLVPIRKRLNGWVWQNVVRDRVDTIMQGFHKRTPARLEREWFVNWRSRNTRSEAAFGQGPFRELGNIEIPFVVVQNLGYLNLHQIDSYDLFENASTPANRKWMILERPHYELPVFAWQLEALAFFDHIVKGVENGYREQAGVRYWLEGENRYATATVFPIAAARRLRFYPGPGQDLFGPQPLTPETKEGIASWNAVPPHTELVGGLAEIMNQKLIYDYLAEKDIEIAGPVTLQLRFSCNEIDSYIVARVGRVDASGQYHLSFYWRDESRPTAHKLGAQHRLRNCP